MLVGDFNFYHSVADINKLGGNVLDMNTFNSIISRLGIIEIPLKGQSFTWSNMQSDPLLVQLDWCFTSISWTVAIPNTLLVPLAKTTSDHIPCGAQVGSSIPRF
jgi:endonuclease/exonuclease/phosphatase family metal-dependent hydrolase